VEFAENVGNVRHGPLAELWSTPFEWVNPVRSFPSFRGQANFTGLYYAATMDLVVQQLWRTQLGGLGAGVAEAPADGLDGHP
jgi:hypothetical protein